MKSIKVEFYYIQYLITETDKKKKHNKKKTYLHEYLNCIARGYDLNEDFMDLLEKESGALLKTDYFTGV